MSEKIKLYWDTYNEDISPLDIVEPDGTCHMSYYDRVDGSFGWIKLNKTDINPADKNYNKRFILIGEL